MKILFTEQDNTGKRNCSFVALLRRFEHFDMERLFVYFYLFTYSFGR